MASDKAREIVRGAFNNGYEQGYERGFREAQEMALATRRQTSRREVAAEILRRLEGGPQPADVMLALAGELHVGVRTVERAKSEAGIVSVQVRRGVWVWATQDQAMGLGKSVRQPASQLAFAA